MRTHATALAATLAALTIAPHAPAQTVTGTPLDGVVGAAATAANGVLGNAPPAQASSGGPSSRSRSRSRRARTPTLGTALPANAPRQLLLVQADGYMNLPLETFNTMRQLHPPPFDWAADGCSFGEVSGPFRDAFNRACNRHDFGYRNYGGGGLALDVTEARRARVDDRLRDDLNGVCRGEFRGLTETPCLAAAQAVYGAARAMGGSWFTSRTGRPPSVPTPSVPGFNNGANRGPVPGVPLPGLGGNGGNSGVGLPIPGAGGGNGAALPIPGAGGAPNPAQVLTGGR